MKKELLRRVQLEQLEILKEIDRVCTEHNIMYFLDSGTLIGAVRHKGFIPWDDDIDIGMLREEYEKFSAIAKESLGSDYIWQTWRNDSSYALPFGKVRRKNTVFIEEKGASEGECGFYVDVFPFDNAPSDNVQRKRLVKKRVFLARSLLMKHNYSPWIINGKTDVKKRIGYFLYQICSLFYSHKRIVKKYEMIVSAVPNSDEVYENIGKTNTHYYKKEWFSSVKKTKFEDGMFSIPSGTHERLTEEYGNYMKLPPEDKRENRHSVIKIKFSTGEEYNNV